MVVILLRFADKAKSICDVHAKDSATTAMYLHIRNIEPKLLFRIIELEKMSVDVFAANLF